MKKKPVYRQLVTSPLLRSILTLFSGKATAHVILIASSPIIARLFTPSDFGIAALVLAAAAVAAPLGTLGYGTAAQLTDTDSDARRLLRIAFASTFLFSILMVAGIFLYHTYRGPDHSPLGDAWVWAWAVPVIFAIHGIESALVSWNTRRKQFKVQATTYVSSAAVGTGSRIGFGLIGGSSVAGLVIGWVLGLITRTAVLARHSGLLDSSRNPDAPPRSYRALAVAYRDFPLFSTPTALLNGASSKFPVFFFGALFSPAVAGFYAMSDRLFMRPLILLQASVRSVFTQHLVTALKQGRSITSTLFKACAFTGLVMLIPTVFLATYGEPAIVLLLTDKWRTVGVFIEITAPLMLFASIVVPASAAMVVCRQQRQLFILQIVTTLTLVAGFIASYMIWGTPETTLRTMVVILAVRHSYTVLVAFVAVRRREREGGPAPDINARAAP
jgi:O-antigen/teichoic acid export membrane protein